MANDRARSPQHALQVEYGPLPQLPPLALRWDYRELLLRQPGYRRRYELRADGWERIVEVFVFADADAAAAALACDARRAFAAAHPACRDTAQTLLLDPGSTRGAPAILLHHPCGDAGTAAGDGRRERLARGPGEVPGRL